jgi:hypothetical protein
MAKTASKKRTPPKRSRESTQTLIPTSIPKHEFPSRPPSVQIIFTGLECFAFDGSRNCDIGIHNTTHASPFQPHEFRMQKWERTRLNGDSRCPLRPIKTDYLPQAPERVARVQIDVVNPDEDVFTDPDEGVLDGVYVYQRQGDFIRTSPDNDSKDFRWTLDVEGPDFYGVGLDKDFIKLDPVVKINNGLFFTVDRTKSKFTRRSEGASGGPPDLELNHIAGIIAANIYLKPSASEVRVFVDGVRKDTITRNDDFIYQLDVLNDCPRPHLCPYDPRSAHDKVNRNDFYLYYDSIFAPQDSREFGLICSLIRPRELDATVCGVRLGDVSDPSPCVGIIFGQTTSLT